MNATVNFPVRATFLPVTKGQFFPPSYLWKKGPQMKDPKSGLRPLQSILFELRDDSSKEVAKRGTEGLAFTESKFSPNNLQHLNFSSGEVDSSFLDSFFQGPEAPNSTPGVPQLYAESATAADSTLVLGKNPDSKSPALNRFCNADPTAGISPSDTVQKVYTPSIANQVLDAQSSPLDWLLGNRATSPYTKVLAALVRLEARANKEHDVCEAEDFRQTWLAVRYLETGECTMLGEAIALACLRMFGVNILQLQNKITARRMAKLGKEYPDWFDANGALIPDSEVLARKNGEPGAGQAGECPTQTQQPPIALPGISKKPVQSIPSSQVKEETKYEAK